MKHCICSTQNTTYLKSLTQKVNQGCSVHNQNLNKALTTEPMQLLSGIYSVVEVAESFQSCYSLVMVTQGFTTAQKVVYSNPWIGMVMHLYLLSITWTLLCDHSRLRMDGTLWLEPKVSGGGVGGKHTVSFTERNVAWQHNSATHSLSRHGQALFAKLCGGWAKRLLNQLISFGSLTVLSATEVRHKDLWYLNKEWTT